jgi:hypothetical protein
MSIVSSLELAASGVDSELVAPQSEQRVRPEPLRLTPLEPHFEHFMRPPFAL